ncbi:MAG: NAD(P)/FAD-dependent oxidoreductase, partial [Bdellovibrionales bacterium]|nr:NAD(P)/FAD-dependent oxidoreductase [Bdellovibrionales bacterium]
PLLYQVATAGLSPADIATPIRSIMSPFKNIQVKMGEVIFIDFEKQKVQTAVEEFSFDYLVLACGAKHGYFGHDEWEPFAPGLKTVEQAVEIRRRILTAYEKAESCKDSETLRALMTFVVVGGGPTGVEMAGAIAEISRKTLEADFRNINPAGTRVILIEAGDRVLAAFDPELSKKATRDLEGLGVQVWTGMRVTKISEGHVELGKEVVKAATVVWAAGVVPTKIKSKPELPLDKSGRIEITKDLRIRGFTNVFALGDQAYFKTHEGSLPGLAPVAIQQGEWTAKNILLLLKGQEPKEFEYVDKGIMATIGKSKAVMQAGKLKVSGFIAWIAWLFVHIYYLIGFHNRVAVFLEWAWQYLTSRKGARLISDRNWKFYPRETALCKAEHSVHPGLTTPDDCPTPRSGNYEARQCDRSGARSTDDGQSQ